MKKKKVLMAALAAATVALGCGAFAACGHSHTYSKEWEKDETGHWHHATCDDLKESDKDYIKDFADHVWGDDNECDICHYVKTSASSVTLDTTELSLGIGNLDATLTATVAGGGTVTWSSDNESVAAVNEDTGYVEALKPGAATITATAENGDTATCEVVVADAYYIIGGMDSAWNKAGAFGDSNVNYFMPTETEGVYKTASIELPKLGNFQIAPVGDTSNDWWKSAFNGDYIAAGDAVLKNSNGNIAVEKHGKYTITLDLTGEKAVVSGVLDEEIDDGETEDVYYIIGSANASTQWNTLTDAAVAGDYAFTDNKGGTYSLTVELTKGGEFKIAIVGMAWNGAMGESALARTGGSCDCETALIGAAGTATPETDYKLVFTSSDNIGVGVSGRYIFTLTPGAEAHHQLTYTFEATAATGAAQVLHYYIKGTAVEGGWNAPADATTELTETGEGTGVYSITIHLSTGEFMFYSYAENSEGNIVATQIDYFNNSNTTLTDEGDCVTASTNYTAKAEGYYTFTLDPAAEGKPVLTVTYSATNPATPEAE